MGKSQRDKGQRREREFAKLIGGHRVPLSGAQEGYENDVIGLGLKWEVKARKDGFKQLYTWLNDEREKPEALALKADRQDWLICMKLDLFQGIMDQLQSCEWMIEDITKIAEEKGYEDILGLFEGNGVDE